MAESLSRPWLYSYFHDIAINNGGKLAEAPLQKKGKRAQLIQFLTCPTSTPDDTWVEVSDKSHYIPIKLTKKAIEEYERTNTEKLTSKVRALVFVEEFRPFLSRVPLPQQKGLSERTTIALEVDKIRFVGGVQEAIVGQPSELESKEDMKMWIEDMRNGGGNVLKNIQEKNKQQEHASPPPQDPPASPVSAQSPSKPREKEFGDVPKPATAKKDQFVLKKYRKHWKNKIGRLDQDPRQFWPTEEVELQLLNVLKFGRDSNTFKMAEDQHDIPPLDPSPTMDVEPTATPISDWVPSDEEEDKVPDPKSRNDMGGGDEEPSTPANDPQSSSHPQGKPLSNSTRITQRTQSQSQNRNENQAPTASSYTPSPQNADAPDYAPPKVLVPDSDISQTQSGSGSGFGSGPVATQSQPGSTQASSSTQTDSSAQVSAFCTQADADASVAPATLSTKRRSPLKEASTPAVNGTSTNQRGSRSVPSPLVAAVGEKKSGAQSQPQSQTANERNSEPGSARSTRKRVRQFTPSSPNREKSPRKRAKAEVPPPLHDPTTWKMPAFEQRKRERELERAKKSALAPQASRSGPNLVKDKEKEASTSSPHLQASKSTSKSISPSRAKPKTSIPQEPEPKQKRKLPFNFNLDLDSDDSDGDAILGGKEIDEILCGVWKSRERDRGK